MEKLKRRNRIEKIVIELGTEGLFIQPNKQKKDLKRYEEINVNGNLYIRSGIYYPDCYRCDSEGNPIELDDNYQPVYYSLYQYETAESIDEDGNPSDYITVGFDVFKQ